MGASEIEVPIFKFPFLIYIETSGTNYPLKKEIPIRFATSIDISGVFNLIIQLITCPFA